MHKKSAIRVTKCQMQLFIKIIICSFVVSVVADTGKVYLFSEVKGIVYLNGEPVPNAKVVRSYEYNSLEHEETVTDASGAFYFPPLHGKSLSSILPIELVVAQSMVVSFNGKDYKIWSNTKRSKAHNSELGGSPLILKCDLVDELKIHREFGSILRTNCSW